MIRFNHRVILFSAYLQSSHHMTKTRSSFMFFTHVKGTFSNLVKVTFSNPVKEQKGEEYDEVKDQTEGQNEYQNEDQNED